MLINDHHDSLVVVQKFVRELIFLLIAARTPCGGAVGKMRR